MQCTANHASDEPLPKRPHALPGQTSDRIDVDKADPDEAQSPPAAQSTVSHEFSNFHRRLRKPMPEEPFIIELCAGSARVTTCLQSIGIGNSFGVDHKRQKHSGRIIVADLTTPEGQQLCWMWLRSPNCMGVFCAPPCGTCSKARGIPVRLPGGRLVPGPQPLRSEDFPDGLENLKGTDKTRVESANLLYSFIT